MKRAVHRILEERIRSLKEEGRTDEIMSLLKQFGKAQDLVSKTHPIANARSPEHLIHIMGSRERFLAKLTESLLSEGRTVVIVLPISLN